MEKLFKSKNLSLNFESYWYKGLNVDSLSKEKTANMDSKKNTAPDDGLKDFLIVVALVCGGFYALSLFVLWLLAKAPGP